MAEITNNRHNYVLINISFHFFLFLLSTMYSLGFKFLFTKILQCKSQDATFKDRVTTTINIAITYNRNVGFL